MLEVVRQATVAADAQTVWALVSDFGNIADWHPACSASLAETVGDAVHRTITVGDGARLIEKLDLKDDATMTLEYSIIEGPLPVSDYRSSLSVAANESGSTLTWSGRFAADGAPEERAKQIVAGIYEGGLEALKKKFG